MPAITFALVIILLASLVFLLRVLVAFMEEPQIGRRRVSVDPLTTFRTSPGSRAASCGYVIVKGPDAQGSPTQVVLLR